MIPMTALLELLRMNRPYRFLRVFEVDIDPNDLRDLLMGEVTKLYATRCAKGVLQVSISDEKLKPKPLTLLEVYDAKCDSAGTRIPGTFALLSGYALSEGDGMNRIRLFRLDVGGRWEPYDGPFFDFVKMRLTEHQPAVAAVHGPTTAVDGMLRMGMLMPVPIPPTQRVSPRDHMTMRVEREVLYVLSSIGAPVEWDAKHGWCVWRDSYLPVFDARPEGHTEVYDSQDNIIGSFQRCAASDIVKAVVSNLLPLSGGSNVFVV